MKQYYYANGDQQLGPFSFQELQTKNIGKDTYVWYEGLSDWTRAGDLPELGVLFQAPEPPAPERPPLQQTTPPPANTGYQNPRNQGQNQARHRQQYNQPSGLKPKTWLVESIIATVICCLIGGIGGIAAIIGIIFASQVDSKWSRGDAAGAERASNNAKICLIIALVLGLLVFVFYLFAFLTGSYY